MASLIILIKTTDLEIIRPESGLYFFGISNLNDLDINPNTYQLSNKFNNLKPGLYQWAVKRVDTGEIKAKGTAQVEGSNSPCFTEYVDNLNYIIISKDRHKLETIGDIETFYKDGNDYIKFLPDEPKILLNGDVLVTTNSPFIGKIVIC